MFRNKEYVLAVWREGSFSKAARRLYVSQPSLSASVRRIEERLGAPIFERNASLSLTEPGKQYIQYALEIEEKEKEFHQYLADYQNLLTGNITIGGSSLFSSFLLPRLISDFNKKYPEIRFEILEDNTKNLLQKLAHGTVDIILDNAIISDKNIQSTVYASEMLLLTVPKAFAVNQELAQYRLTAHDVKMNKHRLGQYAVPIRHFRKEPFILLNPENDTGKRADSILKKSGIAPNVMFYLDQQITAYNISCSGMAVAFVSDTLIRHAETEPPLFYYRIADSEIERNIYFYNKTNRYLSVACQKFLDSNKKRIAPLLL